MGKIIDITGQNFGRLTAIHIMPKEPNAKDRSYKWLCKCDCGNEVVVSGHNLRRGNTKSCGCLQKEAVKKLHFKDLTGQKFGKLTVLRVSDKETNNTHTQWECQCECGNICIVSSDCLTRGLTQSCGCLKQSIATLKIEQLLQQHNIPFQKEYYINYQNSRLFFDYFINQQYIIEYDGGQHFYSTGGWNSPEEFQRRHAKDLLKNQYCFENNISLIRLRYNKDFDFSDLLLETTRYLLTKENEEAYYNGE